MTEYELIGYEITKMRITLASASSVSYSST